MDFGFGPFSQTTGQATSSATSGFGSSVTQGAASPSGTSFAASTPDTLGLLAQISAEVASLAQATGTSNLFGPAFLLPDAHASSLPTAAAASPPGVAPGQSFLRDAVGGAVGIETAVDQSGNILATATLSTGSGLIAGFQLNPLPNQPSLISIDPSTLTTGLPTIQDGAGNTLPVRAFKDSAGGLVLGVDLTGANGARQTFYSQIDSLGYPVGSGVGPVTITDSSGQSVSGQALTSSTGQPFITATLYQPPGFPQQYQTQVPGQLPLTALLTASSTPLSNPTGSTSAPISSFTDATISGATAQQVYLTVNGTPQAFYTANDSGTTPLQPTTVNATATSQAIAFSQNPLLTTVNDSPTIPGLTAFVSNAYRSALTLVATSTPFSAFSTLI